jgi:hypothetical protein
MTVIALAMLAICNHEPKLLQKAKADRLRDPPNNCMRLICELSFVSA